MNALEFIKTFGWEEAEQVALKAGTNRAYFSQIAYGHRNAGTRLAQRLVKESGDRLDLLSLMTATEDAA